MFMTIVKGMLVIFMLAGIVGIIYGAWEIRRTMSFVSTADGRVKGTFVGYRKEITKTKSISSYSPSNPNMPSTTESFALATYPKFTCPTEQGDTVLICESKVHVFAVYKPGDEVDVLLSSSGRHRMASFYSLYFRDLLIAGLGLCALLLALVFWNFALPLITSPHPVAAYSEETSSGADTSQFGDTATVENAFNEILNEAWNYRVGPIRMKHILYGCLGMVLLIIILSFFFGAKRL